MLATFARSLYRAVGTGLGGWARGAGGQPPHPTFGHDRSKPVFFKLRGFHCQVLNESQVAAQNGQKQNVNKESPELSNQPVKSTNLHHVKAKVLLVFNLYKLILI